MVCRIFHSGYFAGPSFGFRPFKSTNDILAILTNHVKAAFLKGKFLVAVFLDIRAAFDNVNPEILLDTLYRLGVPARIRKFVLVLRKQTANLRPQREFNRALSIIARDSSRFRTQSVTFQLIPL